MSAEVLVPLFCGAIPLLPYQNILDALESNIKEDRTDLDLLFGEARKWYMNEAKHKYTGSSRHPRLHLQSGSDEAGKCQK